MLHRMIPLALMFLCAFVQCSEKQPISAPPKYTGDLPQLQARGALRVIVRPDPITYMPRQAEQVTLNYDIARGLAEVLKLNLEIVKVTSYSQMMEKLLIGEGDIVASSLTITPEREAHAAFSVPYLYVDEYLVTASGDSLPEKIADLAGMAISVRRSSSYYQTLVKIQQQVPSLNIHTVPETLSIENLLEGVASGKYAATVSDAHLWHALSGYYDSLVTPIVLAEDRPLALMMRPGDTQLKVKVDEYLLAHQFTRHRQQTFTDDLTGLKERRRLRMITRNNAMTYFIYRGQQIGFEYELMKRFASQHDLRLEIVIPNSHAELLSYLNEGRGDVVASAMTITEVRQEQAAFTQPYNEVSELVVVHADGDSIASLQDLAGRTIHVRASSSFYTTLMALQDSIKGLEIALVPDNVETEDILAGVEEGLYDLTLCDSNLLDIERAYGRRLKAALSIKPTALGWAVRKDNSDLLAALNEYIKEEKGGLFFNIMKKRYFKSTRAVARAKDSMRVGLSGQLSPYDELAKKYASQYGQDWRLITAQMYQESRFDPAAVSWVGAQGLMQVMPSTGEDLGFTDLHEPQESIHAGVKYMHQLINRFDHKLPMEVRIRFALASYNVGYGHVLDARRLAREMGWDPNRWFGNVEQAMRLLSQPDYYERARYGFCRGGQPVHYVKNIQNFYDAYVEILNTTIPAKATQPLSSGFFGSPPATEDRR
ncbi:MAG: membrane-bound lytic murein transglycosylase MltF [Candidatus Latescibacteria bacterium]|nr:membrane-bound lytic murein transglycosylase MltF [Candidatus Latescibacterota bacterium]